MRAAARRSSMRAVTGKPIKFAGVGEALDKLEAFHPERVAGRILGMGDVVSLVERAAETIEVEEAEKLAAKMAKGKFDLDDLWAQLRQMQRMGGLGALAGMMPGLKGMKGAMDKAQDSKALVHMEAMLSSMTAKERAKPEVINAKRKIRVAKGSGTTVQEINKLLKMHQEMSTRDEAAQEDGRPRQAGGDVQQGRLEAALGGLGGSGGAARRPAWARRAAGSSRPRRRDSVQPPPGFQQIFKEIDNVIERKELTYGVCNSSDARRRQEAALLPHRRGRQPQRRATAASSRRSAPTTRCWRRIRPSA